MIFRWMDNAHDEKCTVHFLEYTSIQPQIATVITYMYHLIQNAAHAHDVVYRPFFFGVYLNSSKNCYSYYLSLNSSRIINV